MRGRGKDRREHSLKERRTHSSAPRLLAASHLRAEGLWMDWDCRTGGSDTGTEGHTDPDSPHTRIKSVLLSGPGKRVFRRRPAGTPSSLSLHADVHHAASSSLLCGPAFIIFISCPCCHWRRGTWTGRRPAKMVRLRLASRFEPGTLLL